MRYLIYLLLINLVFSSCKNQNFTFNDKEIQKVNFCDLPNHKNELVAVECFYSGTIEYWGLYGKEKCHPEIHSQLVIKNEIPESFQKIFSKQKDMEVLKIIAIGIFKDDNPDGYGHQGSNNSEFTIYKIISLKNIGKFKPKKKLLLN